MDPLALVCGLLVIGFGVATAIEHYRHGRWEIEQIRQRERERVGSSAVPR